jgi:tetratricopeptide (TPR) repeat protein
MTAQSREISEKNDNLTKQLTANEERINKIEKDLGETRNEILNRTINAYQITNDRINTHLTFISLIATIFGVIIAVGGILIALESIKSQKRREDAIRTLEEAKRYVEDRKESFDQVLLQKLKELNEEYQKLLNLSKEQLFEDINNETQKVRVAAEKKAQEIESYSVEKKSEEALESLNRRLKFFENIGIPDDPKILLSKAQLLIEKGMRNEAIELLAKLIKIDSENSAGYWHLGYEYSHIKEYEKSIGNYLKYIELKPTSAAAYNNLGVSYESVDRTDDALKAFDRAILLDDKKELYCENKARLLLKLSRIDEALVNFKKAIELAPQKESLYTSLIEKFIELKRFEEALEYYDLAIKNLEEKSKEYNFKKASLLKRISRLNESLDILANLAGQNYMSDDGYMLMAEIKFEQNKNEEGITILNNAIALNLKNEALYLKKTSLLVGSQPDKAYETIMEGSGHIKDESLFQRGGRIFCKAGHLEKAKDLYLHANEIVKQKLEKKEEGNILEFYEGLLILEKYEEAETFIEKYKINIISEVRQLVLNYLTLCKKALKDEVADMRDEMKIFDSFFANPEKVIKVSWSFEDFDCFLKTRLKNPDYESLKSLSELIEKKITFDEFKQRFK